MDELEVFISEKFQTNQTALEMYLELWRWFRSAGLADTHFVSDIVRGDDGKFWERVWEMLLAKHLSCQGHSLRSSSQGPDFSFVSENQTVWIEAISPRPEGLPESWLTPPKPGVPRVHSFPHEAILLRWTSAIKEKLDKLEGAGGAKNKNSGYKNKKIVGQSDGYVIAVNGAALSLASDECGISQFPFAVEAVFPVGPIGIPININTMEWGEAETSYRPNVFKKSGASVPTTAFLDPLYRGISAIMGCNVRYAVDPLPVIVVHNPLASNPIPAGVLGAKTEYFASDLGSDYFELKIIEN